MVNQAKTQSLPPPPGVQENPLKATISNFGNKGLLWVAPSSLSLSSGLSDMSFPQNPIEGFDHQLSAIPTQR
jgi:hypothetical protein